MAQTKKLDRPISAKAKMIDFVLNAPDANDVRLAGDFNNWDSARTPLRKSGKEKIWKRSITLKPGRYEYKFVVDGSWISDPTNSNRAVNKFGTENSVIEI